MQSEKKKGKRELRDLIDQEFIKDYIQNICHFSCRRDFIKDYINRKSDNTTKSPLVRDYENILEEEKNRDRKQRKKGKITPKT